MKITKYFLLKLIRKNLKIFFSLVFISALGVSVLISLLNAYAGVKTTFATYFDEYHYPDVTFFASEYLTDQSLNKAAAVDGVARVQGRVMLDADAVCGDKIVTFRCFSADEGDMVRYDETARLPETEYGDYVPMALNAHFVKMAGIELGDVFTVHIRGKAYECIVAGVVSSPECSVVYRDENSTYPTDEFGYAFFRYADLKKIVGVPMNIYNQLLLEVKDGYAPEDVKQSVLDAGVFAKKAEGYTYETSPHKEFIDGCVEPLQILSYLLALVFFVIAVVMIYLFMYQVIMEQKEKSGILMALGASQQQIYTVYVCFGAIITLMAGVVGNLLGYGLMRLIGSIYMSSFYLPYMLYSYNVPLAILGVVAVGVVVTVAVTLAALQIFKLDPADAMRKQVAVTNGTDFGGKLDFAGYAAKVCFACSLRNKRRLILSFLSTILTVTLITFVLQYSDACDHVVEYTYGQRYRYDGQVYFDGELEDAQIEDLLMCENGVVEHWEPFATVKVQLKSDTAELDCTVYAMSDDSELVKLLDRNGKNLNLEKDGIVLSQLDAKKLGVKAGDTITVGDRKLRVSGIYQANTFFVQYVDVETFRTLSDSGWIGAYVRLTDGADRVSLYHQLSGQTGFAYLSMSDSQARGVENSLSRMEIAVLIILMMSFAVGVLIIYNMAVINFEERKRVFGIMMAIGMKIREISWASVIEVLVQYIVSLVTGTLLGMGLGSFMLSAISTDNVQYSLAFTFASGLMMAVVVGAFMLGGQLFALIKLQKLDIVEELKSRE